MSAATYERGKKIIEKGTEGQKNSLRNHSIGISKVYNQIRRQEQKEDLIKQVKEAADRRCQFDNDSSRATFDSRRFSIHRYY